MLIRELRVPEADSSELGELGVVIPPLTPFCLPGGTRAGPSQCLAVLGVGAMYDEPSVLVSSVWATRTLMYTTAAGCAAVMAHTMLSGW